MGKDNLVASIGLKALAEALMKCNNSLQELNLDGNRVCDWGAGWAALVLRNHAVLATVRLCGNPIGKDGIEELTSACLSSQASLVFVSPNADGAGVTESTEVHGQREATVYVTKIDHSLDTWSEAQSSFSRPHSASRRQLLGTTTACSDSTSSLRNLVEVNEKAGAVQTN